MPKQSAILQETALFVQQFLFENLPSAYVYHNYDHAEEVADVCAKLAKAAKLPQDQIELLQIAAWFHDCGYAVQTEKIAEGSATTARNFLESKGYPRQKIEKIEQLIRNLHAGVPPPDDLEKILRDANYSFTGRKRFFRRAELLRLEKEETNDKKFSSNEWNRRLLDLLLNQHFYTIWAKERFWNRRNKNILAQRQNIRKTYQKTIRRKTGKDFGRGIDTLYRITLRNHINLSNIADGKANMIISINTLVLSILITVGAAGVTLDNFSLASNLYYVLPIFILMLTALSAIVVAVLSAIPKVSGSDFDDEDIKQHKVSLLFFGNFLRIDKSKFVRHLRTLKKDQELLYDDLSRDLYNLGLILHKKYRLLTIAYRIFIIGLILSFIAFLITRLI